MPQTEKARLKERAKQDRLILSRIQKEKITKKMINPSKETCHYYVFNNLGGCDYSAIPDKLTCLNCGHYLLTEEIKN